LEVVLSEYDIWFTSDAQTVFKLINNIREKISINKNFDPGLILNPPLILDELILIRQYKDQEPNTYKIFVKFN
jgi:hypothetical protein